MDLTKEEIDNALVITNTGGDHASLTSHYAAIRSEMEAVAKVTHVRIAPRKVRIVIDLIRNKPVGVAMGILNNTPKAASEVLIKLLKSAIANAENNNGMDPSKLYIAECYANCAPTMKRVHPRAQGRAYRILKRMSHITIVLNER